MANTSNHPSPIMQRWMDGFNFIPNPDILPKIPGYFANTCGQLSPNRSAGGTHLHGVWVTNRELRSARHTHTSLHINPDILPKIPGYFANTCGLLTGGLHINPDILPKTPGYFANQPTFGSQHESASCYCHHGSQY